ncbi:hypothetical protein DX928_09230 [Bacillus swezeyi]|nr:hypothetical protein DX928_09230 [Bacillus swezeyi]
MVIFSSFQGQDFEECLLNRFLLQNDRHGCRCQANTKIQQMTHENILRHCGRNHQGGSRYFLRLFSKAVINRSV